MADLYEASTSSPLPNPPHESGDISAFLHHLVHSSSSSSTSTPYLPFKAKPMHAFSSSHPVMPPVPEAASASGTVAPPEDFHQLGGYRVETSNFSEPGVYFPSHVKEGTDKMFDSDANASPRRRGFSAENDLGDFSCDSEGTGGAPEVQLNPAPSSSRPSSKRTRAAEVHNLSEKRRRSRINEKMKALQNLIPNSNKTDKASMLDEAIEYLKQLQLQVQMLSMRNGISLHPMCLPGVLQSVQLSQIGMGFNEETGLLDSNREAVPFSSNQESSMQTAVDISNENTSNLQTEIPSVTTITNLEAPFGFETAEYEPFNLPAPPKEICKEVMLPQHKLEMSGSGNNSSSSGLS